jgi:hypothetical protein
VDYHVTGRTKTLRKITTSRRGRLEEETLVLLGTQGHGDLTTQFSAAADEICSIVFGHFVIHFRSV